MINFMNSEFFLLFFQIDLENCGIVMLTCKEVSELVSRALDGRLGLIERWRLRAHLKACEGCRNFRKQMTFLRDAIRNHPVIKDPEDR